MGCHRRLLDAKKFLNYFRANGYKIVSNPGRADFILVNTCAFKKEQEDFAVKKIQKLKKYKKKLIVCGCLPKINKERLIKIFDGPTFTPGSIEKIDELFHSQIKFNALADANFLYKPHFLSPSHFQDIFQFNSKFFIFAAKHLKKQIEGKYHIRISWGCLGSCSYCNIRKAIGTLKSKPMEKCLEEFKNGLSKKYKNFVIVGDDVGSYGLDINKTFPELLNEILKINGNYEISIQEFHPRWIIRYLDRLIPLFQSEKISELVCPLQSGSDKILKLMQRFHNSEDLKRALFCLKKAYPKLKIITHILLGFPGESEEDFFKTLELIKEVNFDFVAIYTYHEKADTLSAGLADKVSSKTIKQRVKTTKKFLRNFKFYSKG